MTHLACTDSERAFVGCVVSGEGLPLDCCAATDEHFFDHIARSIFVAARELRAADAPVSTFAVMQRLGTERMEQLGGIAAIRDACSFFSPEHAQHYFSILDGKLLLRRAKDLAGWIEQGTDTDDPIRFAAELQKRAASIDPSAEEANTLQTAIDGLEKTIGLIERKQYETGVLSRVGSFNRLFGGMMDGQLYGIASRPGMGKTALMEIMMCDYMHKGDAVTCFERDMSPKKLIERMACRLAGVPYIHLARGLLNDTQISELKRCSAMMRDMPMHLHNPTGLTPDRMCAIARRDIKLHKVRAVFLDHIQTFGHGKDIREKLTSASILIRDNVTTTGVSHFILAHINRNGAKGGRPAPEDIKEFDQLYGDADGMLILWSEKDKADLSPGEMLEVKFYAAKNRDGAVSEDSMLFDGRNMKFVELAKQNAP